MIEFLLLGILASTFIGWMIAIPLLFDIVDRLGTIGKMLATIKYNVNTKDENGDP